MVRRLPVIQNRSSEDDEASARPRSHWIAIAAGLAFTIWLPLVVVATWLGGVVSATYLGAEPEPARAGTALLLLALPIVVSFALACLAAGALVGRFGVRTTRRDAALAGALTALLASGLAALGDAFDQPTTALAVVALLAAVGAGAAALGARLGRPRAPARPSS
ncbi:MAG: hypothetical protein KF718_01705 [Polyangiaceae bacterium]|nr:hypothetical protein [Polyangiaceae bacterium]